MKARQTSPVAILAITVMVVAMAALTVVYFWPAKKSTVQNVPAAGSPTTSTQKSAAVEILEMPPVAKRSGVDAMPLIARLRAWVAENDPETQARLEEELDALLTDANAAEMLRALSQDLLATPFAEAALRRWVKTDRKGAAEWVAQQTGLLEAEQTTVIYGWGMEDKKALDAYIDNLPAGEWKQSAMRFAANDALASGSPKDAIGLLAGMEHSPARDDLFGWSATAWAQSDSAAALKWADSLPDAAQKQAALGAVAVGLAWSDPAAAGKLLAEQVQPGEILDRSALSVVCVWSQTDAESAANWVAQFPEGKLQNTVLETLIQRWAAQDFIGAKGWVNALPTGSLHEQAAQFLATADANLHREGPDQAILPQ